MHTPYSGVHIYVQEVEWNEIQSCIISLLVDFDRKADVEGERETVANVRIRPLSASRHRQTSPPRTVNATRNIEGRNIKDGLWQLVQD